MMKAFLVGALLILGTVHAGEPVVLERLSSERISNYVVEYEQELKSLGAKRKVLFSVGAGLVATVFGLICWRWTHPSAAASGSPLLAISDVDRGPVSFWQRTKNMMSFAWASALYTMVFSEIMAAKNLVVEKLWPKGVDFLSSLSPDDRMLARERQVSERGHSMVELVADYERAVRCTVASKGNDRIEISFVHFLARQVVHKQEMLVCALEKVIACFYATNKDDKECVEELGLRVADFKNVIEESAHELENMLNTPLAPIDQKLELCAKAIATCKDIALYSEQFTAECHQFITHKYI